MKKTFKINQIQFSYCRNEYNRAFENERSVEIPLGDYFLDKFSNGVLEIGAVMPYYGKDSHCIIDLTDPHPKSIKANALNCDYKNKNILSISSVEHMMKKEYGNGSDMDSIRVLEKILDESANFLITWGIGYNYVLDGFIKNNPSIPRFILKRVSQDNIYLVNRDSFDFSFPFGHSDRPIPQGFFNNANAVCVLTNLPELLKYPYVV